MLRHPGQGVPSVIDVGNRVLLLLRQRERRLLQLLAVRTVAEILGHTGLPPCAGSPLVPARRLAKRAEPIAHPATSLRLPSVVKRGFEGSEDRGLPCRCGRG